MSRPSRHRIRLRHASSLALRATLRDGLRMTKPDPVLNTNSQTFLDHSSGIILKGVKRKSGRDICGGADAPCDSLSPGCALYACPGLPEILIIRKMSSPPVLVLMSLIMQVENSDSGDSRKGNPRKGIERWDRGQGGNSAGRPKARPGLLCWPSGSWSWHLWLAIDDFERMAIQGSYIMQLVQEALRLKMWSCLRWTAIMAVTMLVRVDFTEE